MIRNNIQIDLKPGWMFLLSLLLHLAAVVIFSRAQLFSIDRHEQPEYYVDLVSLPTIEPSAGTPQAPPSKATARPVPQQTTPPKPPAAPAMTLPSKTPSPKAQKQHQAMPTAAEEEIRAQQEFNERLNRMQYNSDAKRQAAVLESLQKKIAAGAKSGTPSGRGTSPGYDYGTYIQSRLKDALATTMVYRSKHPEAAVHLYIDKTGKLIRYDMVKQSSDKLFNDSVIRTIEKARTGFPATPDGAGFDKLYLFSPQEVSEK